MAKSTQHAKVPDIGFDLNENSALARANRTLASMPSATPIESNESMTSAGRLNQMLEQDSPLMQRARTQGLQMGNKRGLLNSSMAVGAAQGAMIDRAQPYALSDSANLYQNARQDAAAANDRSLMQASTLADSFLSNQDYQQQAGLVGLEGDERMRELFGTSMANAWGVMGNNVTDIVAQAMIEIGDIQNNPNIKSGDKKKMIDQVIKARNTDVEFQADLYRSLADELRDTGVFPQVA